MKKLKKVIGELNSCSLSAIIKKEQLITKYNRHWKTISQAFKRWGVNNDKK